MSLNEGQRMEPGQNTHGGLREVALGAQKGFGCIGHAHWDEQLDEQLECSGIATEHSSLGSWCD